MIHKDQSKVIFNSSLQRKLEPESTNMMLTKTNVYNTTIKTKSESKNLAVLLQNGDLLLSNSDRQFDDSSVEEKRNEY